MSKCLEIVILFKIVLFLLFVWHSEWTETFPNDFKDEVMMMHIKDITSYCASLTLVCTDLVIFFTVKKK